MGCTGDRPTDWAKLSGEADLVTRAWVWLALIRWVRSPGGTHTLLCVSIVRQVTLVRGLQAVEAKEQGSATMEVELSHASVEGIWSRNSVRLQPGPMCHLAVSGPVHSLTLSGLRPQDSGLVAFRAEGVHTSARLVVTGEWVSGCPLTWGDTLGVLKGSQCYLAFFLSLRATRDLQPPTAGCSGDPEREDDSGV